jgi:hypothetical protein
MRGLSLKKYPSPLCDRGGCFLFWCVNMLSELLRWLYSFVGGLKRIAARKRVA